MPRPMKPSDGLASAAGHLDVAKCFETHINGIVFAFQQLQQQIHELQQADTSGKAETHMPVGCFTWSEPRFEQTSRLEAGRHASITPPAPISPQMSQDTRKSKRISISAYEEQLEIDEVALKQLQSQFNRIDKSSSGYLELPEIKCVMNTFFDDWELEDLPELIAHLDRLARADTMPEHVLKKQPSRQLSKAQISRQGAHVDGISFDMFVILCVSEKLLQPPTPNSIRRDADQLRRGFMNENQLALYADDGHLGDNKHDRVPMWLQAVLLDILPAIVIILNAICIGLSSDVEKESVVWQVLEFVFLAFYLLECVYKVWLFGWRWYFTGPDWRWNVFDIICLLLSIGDAALSTALLFVSEDGAIDLDGFMLLKVARISRLFRLVRTLRYEVFNELKTMVLGVISGVRCLVWAMVLLFVLIYIFGIASKQLLGSREPEFETVPAAMFTLFRCFTEGCAAYDGTPLTERLRHKYGTFFMAPYLILFMGISLGVFNLVTATFIDNVMTSQLLRKLNEISSTANQYEVEIKEHLLRLIMQSRTNGVPPEVEQEIMSLSETLQNHAARIRAQFSILENSDVVITHSAFVAILKDPKFQRVLIEASIETANTSSIFDVLDADMSGWLSVREVFHGLMRLRGPICKSEIVGIRLRCRHIAQTVHEMDACAM